MTREKKLVKVRPKTAKMTRDKKLVMDRLKTSPEEALGQMRELADYISLTLDKDAENKRKREDIYKISQEQAQGEIKKLEDELSLMQDAHKTSLEQEQGEKKQLADELSLTRETLEKMTNNCELYNKRVQLEKCNLETTLAATVNEKNELHIVHRSVQLEKCNLETKLATAMKEKNELQIVHEKCQLTLSEEKDKRLCEICMESVKDSVCLPCVHLRYCFGCLEKHRQLSGTCPCCRVPLHGVIRLNISMLDH